jgi:exopolysaccharide biosynthesis protein
MKKQSLILLSVSILGGLAVGGTMAGNLLDTFYGTHAAGVVSSTSENFWGESSTSAASTTSTSTSSTSTSSSSATSSGTTSSATSSSSVTSVTYTTGTYKVLSGKSVTYHLVEAKLSSTSHIRRNIATNSSGEYGANIAATISSQVSTVTSQGYNVLAAINGDSCYWGTATDGYVIVNGVTYTSNQRTYNTLDDFAIYKDCTVGTFTETSTSIDTVTSTRGGCWQNWGFGPSLVKDGVVTVTSSSNIGGARSTGSNPRTAIGYAGVNHYFFLTTDVYGGNRSATGCEFSLIDLGNFLLAKGCTYAYNLDGGHTSSMYVASEGSGMVNDNTYGKEYTISDIIYVYD